MIFKNRQPQPTGRSFACAECGVAVIEPTTIIRMIAEGSEDLIMPGVVVLKDKPVEVALARCGECAARHELADAVTSAHPRVTRPMGSRSYALDRVLGALDALDAVGAGAEMMESFTRTDRDLRMLLAFLSPVGIAARWSSELLPIVRHGASGRYPAPKRWAHLSEVQAQSLRDEFARLLHERTSPSGPVPVAPPEGGGCLFCGVGTIMAMPEDAEFAWGRRRRAVSATLGGPHRPEAIHGYLCPTCTRAADSAGSLGPTALERALIASLQANKNRLDDLGLIGIRAWAVLPAGTPPNRTPWEHEPDHQGIAELIETA